MLKSVSYQVFSRLLWVNLVTAALMLSLLLPSHAQVSLEQPSQLGQTGLINMPDARIAPEGALRFGYSQLQPYRALWSSVSLFPRFEMSARYTEIENVPVFGNRPDGDFGDYKDKAFDAKLVLLKEGKYWPQISIGTQDYLGTKLFEANYVAFSKSLGDVDISLGYGEKRIDGGFGGIHYRPSWLDNWSFSAEYDAFMYQQDVRATESGATDRGDTAYGINYQWGWLGAQLAYQGGEYGLNAHIAIPLMAPEFIPKFEEPAPFSEVITRPTIAQWQQDSTHAEALVNALEVQAYKNVRIWLNGQTLEVGVATPRISLIARAVGRALRTALLMGPTDIKAIKVTYFTLTDVAVVSYTFTDLAKLDTFFSGKLTYGELLEVLTVEYSDPELAQALVENGFLPQSTQVDTGLQVLRNDDGHAISLKQSDQTLNRFSLVPFQLNVFFNDPSGAFKYDWFALAAYQRYLGSRWFFNVSARATVLEDVSDVTQPSNSLLPHVRTDVAEYKREKGLKLNTLLLNKFMHLAPRVYGRWSLGIYEEMFGGTGGQILYLPNQSNWAVDLAVDWLRQRDFEGGLDFRDYETTTAIASVHYQIKDYGVTLSLRGGRFLAKDEGGRFEFSRRFRSGFQIGAWYTHTNGNDITGPGSPGDPYDDKGIFIQIPLNSMLSKDTRAKPIASIRPWTRDVGQLVASPADLYDQFEDVLLLDRPQFHLLSGFHD